MLLEWIANIGKLFGQPAVWAVIGIIGYCVINQPIFGRTLLLVLFTMIYNTFLKSIWQEPLPLPLEGWAFPSGHMHSAFVFWGWIAVEYRKLWLSAIIFFILCLVGYGLIYHGYHYPRDIMGAVGFGTLSMIIYALLLRLTFFKEKPYRLGVLLTIIAIICILLTPPIGRKLHMWQGLGALIGLTLGWKLDGLKHKVKVQTLSKKLNSLILSLIGAGIIIFSFKKIPVAPALNIGLTFFFVGIWIGYLSLLTTLGCPERRTNMNKV